MPRPRWQEKTDPNRAQLADIITAQAGGFIDPLGDPEATSRGLADARKRASQRGRERTGREFTEYQMDVRDYESDKRYGRQVELADAAAGRSKTAADLRYDRSKTAADKRYGREKDIAGIRNKYITERTQTLKSPGGGTYEYDPVTKEKTAIFADPKPQPVIPDYGNQPRSFVENDTLFEYKKDPTSSNWILGKGSPVGQGPSPDHVVYSLDDQVKSEDKYQKALKTFKETPTDRMGKAERQRQTQTLSRLYLDMTAKKTGDSSEYMAKRITSYITGIDKDGGWWGPDPGKVFDPTSREPEALLVQYMINANYSDPDIDIKLKNGAVMPFGQWLQRQKEIYFENVESQETEAFQGLIRPLKNQGVVKEEDIT